MSGTRDAFAVSRRIRTTAGEHLESPPPPPTSWWVGAGWESSEVTGPNGFVHVAGGSCLAWALNREEIEDKRRTSAGGIGFSVLDPG